MRKIRLFAHVSADSVMQPHGNDDFANGGWSSPYRSPTGAEALAERQGQYDLLLGRRTYDLWASFWPSVKGGPFADKINGAKKYVMTHRSAGLEWGPVEGIVGDIVEGVRRIKSTSGPDLVVWGTTTLTPLLFEHKLVDEVVLLVYPILLGGGIRFADHVDTSRLAYVNTTATPTGVLVNTYRRVD